MKSRLALFSLIIPLTLNAPNLPDDKLTPGAIRNVTAEELCTHSTKEVRHTGLATKLAVYRAYKIAARNDPSCTGPSHSCFEIDHRVPLEDGGADVKENLWPQPYDGPWNAHQKDQLENFVHREICAGRMTVEEGQKIFLGNWIENYKLYIGVKQ